MKKRAIKKVILTFFVTLFVVFGGAFFSKQTHASVQSNFIKKSEPGVETYSHKYNLYGSVMMAQGALESTWGQSTLATKGNNYFGIKGSYNGQSVKMTTTEYDSQGRLYTTKAYFKKYPNADASYKDNALTIRGNSVYRNVWRENAATYQNATSALQGTYATDIAYASKLNSVIRTYGLTQFDSFIGVNYRSVSRNQRANLSGKWKNYRAYNHVANSRAGVTNVKIKKMRGYKGKRVYIDNRATTKDTGAVWYRIRFGKNGKKYWVKAGAIKFFRVSYSKVNYQKKVLKGKKTKMYNHAYNSSRLATVVGNARQLGRGTYHIDQRAKVYNPGKSATYYRLDYNGKTVWMNSSAFNAKKKAPSKNKTHVKKR